MPADPQILRQVMGRFAAGVTVITSVHGEERHGMTATAVCSLSLNPPLLLVAVDHRASMCEFLKRSGNYAVNILTTEQEHLSGRFAKPGPKEFSDIPLTTGESGAPIFTEALAHADCKIRHILPGGDHDIFVGGILGGGTGESEPLLHYHGKYRHLADLV